MAGPTGPGANQRFGPYSLHQQGCVHATNQVKQCPSVVISVSNRQQVLHQAPVLAPSHHPPSLGLLPSPRPPPSFICRHQRLYFFSSEEELPLLPSDEPPPEEEDCCPDSDSPIFIDAALSAWILALSTSASSP
jgi:hypothetical protein